KSHFTMGQSPLRSPSTLVSSAKYAIFKLFIGRAHYTAHLLVGSFVVDERAPIRRHCEEAVGRRSNPGGVASFAGLLRYARNDDPSHERPHPPRYRRLLRAPRRCGIDLRAPRGQ